MYNNLVSFETAYVINEEELDEILCCDVCYELGIPMIEGYEEGFTAFKYMREEMKKAGHGKKV